MTRRARDETKLRVCSSAPFPSCVALVQLFILATPITFAPEWATRYMRPIPCIQRRENLRSSKAKKDLRILLDSRGLYYRTRHHTKLQRPLEGFVSLSVKQAAINRLGKGCL